MPKIPGFDRPQYTSVEQYLLELAKDIAIQVLVPAKRNRFTEQLRIYAEFCQEWKTAEDADRKGCWKPEMGRPECIFDIFSRRYNFLNEPDKNSKQLTGSYALCALIHDSQLPHLDKINADIIPGEAIEATLSAPKSTLEDTLVGNWSTGQDVREIYLIEEFYNRVTVDLQEFCKSEENKLKQQSVKKQIQEASELSDNEFLKLTAQKFEDRAREVLSKGETWHDLDRSLSGWFDSAIDRLRKLGFSEDEIGLLDYIYNNLLHYAKQISIKSFRGSLDLRIKGLASSRALELAAKFKEIDLLNRDNKPQKGSYKAQQKLAIKEADELRAEAERHPNKDIFLLYSYVDQALAQAVDLAKMTRGKTCLPADQFIAKQVRLFEYIQRIETYPDIASIFEHWPPDPGIQFACLAGRNALDVATRFARMVYNGVLVARNEISCRGITSYDNLMVSPGPDAAFAGWQKRTIEELSTRQIPKSDVWPSMADIHREYQSLAYKLEAEYKQAIECNNHNEPPKIVGDIITPWGIPIRWRVALARLKRLVSRVFRKSSR